LKGIKVLDLSRLLPGPFASLILADLGAQVDKIEDLGGGDYLRHMPPLVGDQSSIFLSINRNKRSACIDLKKPAAQAAFRAMALSYDVILDQFRPGVLDRLGLAHDTLLAANPRLVICALTGYGQTGPLAKRAGHDLNYLARAGVLGLQGPKDQPPAVPGFQLADFGGGLWSVIGILAALAEREKTGQGRVVDIAMYEASMGFASAAFGLAFAGGAPPRRGDEPLIGGIAPYSTYETKDGKHVTLAALEPKFWMSFCAGVGLEAEMSAMIPGPHQDDLRAKLAAIFLGKTRDEWAAYGKERDCCLEPVLTIDEVRHDPHLEARGVFFAMNSPWGTIAQMRTPLTPVGKEHAPPPKQGEHTEAILREAGVSAETIAAMRSEGSIA
jgi:crotonobetainyl-CoA:carnitine CoA-transferase CaiB-like acyl-CoA transferase